MQSPVARLFIYRVCAQVSAARRLRPVALHSAFRGCRSSVARLSPYTVHHLSWHRSGYPKGGTPVTKGETAEVRAVVQQWLERNAAKWQERESLGGLLQHAVKVSGMFWLCTVHYTTDGISQEQRSLIRLNTDFRSDVQWWCHFMEGWNGVGILPFPETERVELVSDASSSWGCAAVWGTQWWQWYWNAKAESWHVAPKELLPVLLLCIV